MQEDCRRVGGLEQECGTNIRTLMDNDDDDGHNLWGIDRVMEGALNAPNIVATQLP